MQIAARASDGREAGRPGRGRGQAGPGQGGREPALRAPWPAAALAGAMVALYALQQASGDASAAATLFGLNAARLAQGDVSALFTSLFVHASWTHVLVNALAALAFGAPVARMFGLRPVQAALYLLFFLACGVLGSLAFVALHASDHGVLVGASGGVAGLMGLASRITPREPTLAPLTSRPVLIMALVWSVANVLLGFMSLGGRPGSAPLAWEAHLVGYAAGLLLAAPACRLARTL